MNLKMDWGDHDPDAIELNWETETVDLMIDNNEPLYLAKQKLLWAVTRLTPFDVARFVKNWRPSIQRELVECRNPIEWGKLDYNGLAKQWTEEIRQLYPKTIEQACHVAEAIAEHGRSKITTDSFRDMSPFKALGKVYIGYELACACLTLCIGMGVNVDGIKFPMPADYPPEDE